MSDGLEKRGKKPLCHCDRSPSKRFSPQKAFRDFIANSTLNNEKPDQTALENVTAPDNGAFTHSINIY